MIFPFIFQESRGKRPLKIWDSWRNIRKGLVVGSFEELIVRGNDTNSAEKFSFSILEKGKKKFFFVTFVYTEMIFLYIWDGEDTWELFKTNFILSRSKTIFIFVGFS